MILDSCCFSYSPRYLSWACPGIGHIRLEDGTVALSGSDETFYCSYFIKIKVWRWKTYIIIHRKIEVLSIYAIFTKKRKRKEYLMFNEGDGIFITHEIIKLI